MTKKSNYSDVQRIDKESVIKKLIAVLAISAVIFVALVILRMFTGSKKSKAPEKTQESADLTMVPATIHYYDAGANTYDIGTNYIIISDSNGYLKVDSEGSVSRVSSDGTFLKDATDDEKKTAIATAGTIIKSDRQASLALDGLDQAAYTTPEIPPMEISPIESLYGRVEQMGYSKDDFLKKVYLTGSTPDDVVRLVESGADEDSVIKSIMAYTSDEKRNEKSNAITVDIEKIGLDRGSANTVSQDNVSESTSKYPSWLKEADPTADMSALVNTLGSIASGGSTSSQGAWESTNKQSEKTGWMNDQQNAKVTATKLTRYDLVAGTTVPITIVTGVNTDLPGQIVGLVRQDVYDSLTGTNVLIPKGSRLIATYNSSVSFGQKSVQIAWSQLITPDGYQFSLPGFSGTSPEGYAGVGDKYSNHFWALLGGAVMGSLLDWGAVYAENKAGSLLGANELSELFSALTGSAVNTTSTIGQKYAELWMNLQPTIKIRTGTQTQLLVNQTISLKRPTTTSFKVTM